MLIEIHQETDRGDIVTMQEDLMVIWKDRVLRIQEGFASDGCSTPRFLWDSVSPAVHPQTIRAAIAHDYLYRTQPEGWTRKDADDMFYDLCREDGFSWWKSQKAYWGLRLFGGSAWEENRERKEKHAEV
jgi:hypothetical protein